MEAAVYENPVMGGINERDLAGRRERHRMDTYEGGGLNGYDTDAVANICTTAGNGMKYGKDFITYAGIQDDADDSEESLYG